MPNSTVKPKPKAKAKSPNEGTKGAGKGKGEEKGKDKSKEKKGAEAKPKAKANVPCLFYPKGTCNRGENCPFVHEQKPKTAVKAKPAAVPKAAVAFVVCASGVSQSSASEIHQHDSSRLKRSAWAMFKSSISAIVRPFVTLLSIATGCLDQQVFASLATLHDSSGVGVKDAMYLSSWRIEVSFVAVPKRKARNTPKTDASFSCPAVLSNQPAMFAQSSNASRHEIEWIADSGASRDLCSERAFLQQGFTKSMFDNHSIEVDPTKFETGNGTFVSNSCISLEGSAFGKASFHVMNDCPLVRSLGKIVQDDGKPFANYHFSV